MKAVTSNGRIEAVAAAGAVDAIEQWQHRHRGD